MSDTTNNSTVYRETFPKSIKATRRMSITEAEFKEVARKIKDSISIEYGDPLDVKHLDFCRWVIEKVADGTILVEEDHE